MTQQSLTIWTIGHGTRSGEEFVQMLQKAGVQCLVDVRSYPGSRRNPQFSREPLASLLASQGIKYKWEGEGLGGFRKARPDSKHIALRSEGFRGYADYMESAEFKQAIERLINDAEQTKIAYMCAERLPWQCHRNLISDYLVMRGMHVVHLVAQGKTQEHTLNPITRIQNDILFYDGKTQLNLEAF
ncbi:MAG TPA: DUF488 domain-containing protein [Burkholderiales bacterium]|nr:DUF488 domain-containing protein [Burkholderiales bacterium]